MYKLYHGDCRKFLFDGTIEPDSIDLTVTSPPYDNLRSYNNSSTWGWPEFFAIAAGLWRVTKPGGVVVWVVNDATVKGSETGSSFEQALLFKKMGFNLHDTMIYSKPNFSAVGALQTRYAPTFEYMMVFAKGRLSTFNPIKDRICKTKGKIKSGTIRQKDGSVKRMSNEGWVQPAFGQRYNVWNLSPQTQNGHPAPFPEQLAHDHILSWSNEGDTVFDPFLGSGTTGAACAHLGRKFIGCEIDDKYFDIAKARIEQAHQKIGEELAG